MTEAQMSVNSVMRNKRAASMQWHQRGTIFLEVNVELI